MDVWHSFNWMHVARAQISWVPAFHKYLLKTFKVWEEELMASKWLLLLISWEVIVYTATGVCNRQLGLLVQLTSKNKHVLIVLHRTANWSAIWAICWISALWYLPAVLKCIHTQLVTNLIIITKYLFLVTTREWNSISESKHPFHCYVAAIIKCTSHSPSFEYA